MRLINQVRDSFPKFSRSAFSIYFFIQVIFMLFIIPAFAADVTISWQPNPESDVLGYRLYYGLESGNYEFTACDVSEVTTCTVNNLEYGRSYYFALAAYDASGESDYSEELSLEIPANLKTYSIVSSAGDQGNIAPSGTVSINLGADQTFAITPDAGYHVINVMVDGAAKGPATGYSFYNVAENHTISAVFGLNTYQITASAGTNGNISPAGTLSVSHGAGQTFAITPEASYQIADVQVDGASVGAVSSYQFNGITGNHSISANFAPIVNNQLCQVTIAWQPNLESDVKGYRLYYGVESGSYKYMACDVAQTNCSVSNLEPGRVYYFAVRAYDRSSEGGWSEELAVAAQGCGNVDSDGDGIADKDELNTFGLSMSMVDTDGDGLNDGDELAYWKDNWNADNDGDGLSNMSDWDADGDGFSDGEEVAAGFDAGDPDSKPMALPLEIGELNVDHQWTQVTFNRKFFNPAVVAKILSSDDADPAVVRIRNVTATGFEIRIQEWDYLDDVHSLESVGYMVLEVGSYMLPGGILVEAGKFETSAAGAFDSHAFNEIFNAVPVLTASITTFNESDAATIRVKNITREGFEFGLQEQEANIQAHATEEIAYIAWEPSSGSFDGITFEVGKTNDAVTAKYQKIYLFEMFPTIPINLTFMQTYHGHDTSDIRCTNKAEDGFEVKIAEEKSREPEVSHVTEVVGYMVFEKID